MGKMSNDIDWQWVLVQLYVTFSTRTSPPSLEILATKRFSPSFRIELRARYFSLIHTRPDTQYFSLCLHNLVNQSGQSGYMPSYTDHLTRSQGDSLVAERPQYLATHRGGYFQFKLAIFVSTLRKNHVETLIAAA